MYRNVESSNDEDDSDESSNDSVHSSNANDSYESDESWDSANDHKVAWVGNQKTPLTSIKLKKYVLKICDEGEKLNQKMRDKGLIAFGDKVDDEKDDRRALVEKYSGSSILFPGRFNHRTMKDLSTEQGQDSIAYWNVIYAEVEKYTKRGNWRTGRTATRFPNWITVADGSKNSWLNRQIKTNIKKSKHPWENEAKWMKMAAISRLEGIRNT